MIRHAVTRTQEQEGSHQRILNQIFGVPWCPGQIPAVPEKFRAHRLEFFSELPEGSPDGLGNSRKAFVCHEGETANQARKDTSDPTPLAFFFEGGAGTPLALRNDHGTNRLV